MSHARRGFIRIRRGIECASADAHFGNYSSVEACEQACAATRGCRFFIYGTGKKAGHCWQEFTESPTCAEGWEPDAFDFYSLVRYSLVGSVRLHGGGECQSPDMLLGKFQAVHECALACAGMSGCRFFIYGSGAKAGSCWHELSESADCPEGYQDDDYDFYQLTVTPSGSLASPPRSPPLGLTPWRPWQPPPPPNPPLPPSLPAPSHLPCAPCGHPVGTLGTFVAGALVALLSSSVLRRVRGANDRRMDGARSGASHVALPLSDPDGGPLL